MLAVELERPGVIRATKEFTHTAIAIGHDLSAFVRATVVEHAHAAIAGSSHHHVLRTQARGVVIPRARHLTFVPHIDPGRAVNARHLELENGGIGIDAFMNAVVTNHVG